MPFQDNNACRWAMPTYPCGVIWHANGSSAVLLFLRDHAADATLRMHHVALIPRNDVDVHGNDGREKMDPGQRLRRFRGDGMVTDQPRFASGHGAKPMGRLPFAGDSMSCRMASKIDLNCLSYFRSSCASFSASSL